MSRSKRQPVIKDKPRNYKAATYYRRIRRVLKQLVGMLEEDLPDPKTIVNDYDYSDYKFDFRHNDDDDYNKQKYSKK